MGSSVPAPGPPPLSANFRVHMKPQRIEGRVKVHLLAASEPSATQLTVGLA